MDDPTWSGVSGKGDGGPANAGSVVWIIHRASRVSARNGGNSVRIYTSAGSWPILQFLWYPERALVSLYNWTECRRSTNGRTKPSFGAICRAVYLRLVIANFFIVVTTIAEWNWIAFSKSKFRSLTFLLLIFQKSNRGWRLLL